MSLGLLSVWLLAAGAAAADTPGPASDRARRVQQECLADPPSLAAILRDPRLPEAADPLKAALVAVHRCRALTSGKPAHCAALRPLCIEHGAMAGRPCESLESHCLEEVDLARLARAAITGSSDTLRLCDTKAICADHMNCVADPESPAFRGRMCEAFVGGLGRPEEWRARLTALCDRKPDDPETDKIVRQWRAVTGDAGACPGEKDPIDDCGEYAVFRAAHAAKDRKLCGDSPFCLWAMGKPVGACARYERRVAVEYCKAKAHAAGVSR